ncbi:MAG TPA: endonuclease/exonuclease/phosphatase family protein [Trebonia sp.]|nr:endonuclease/exonuclease/phosphatase family protein [Trebonia sp.]
MTRALRLLTWNVSGGTGTGSPASRLSTRLSSQPARMSSPSRKPGVTATSGRNWTVSQTCWAFHVAAAEPEGAAGDLGLGIVSRWPLAGRQVHSLPVAGSPPDSRIALEAEVMTPRGVLPVCTTHLSWPLDQSHVRQAQARAIVTAVATREASTRLPTVLCGDFNAEPGSDEIRMLNGQAAVPVPGVVFQDAWQVAGDGSPGHTWSRRNPEAARERFGDARLDYILIQWAGRGAVLSAEVIDGRLPGGTWGSDHLAVLAELDLDALAGKAPDPGA